MKKMLPIIGSVLLLTALVYFSGPAKLFSLLLGADKVLIALGIGVWFLTSLLRTRRWQSLLKETGIQTSFPTAYRVFNAGLFISIITPGKVGDPARSALLKKATGESFSKSLPTIVVERIFDIVVMTILGVFGILSSPVDGVKNYFIVATGIYAFAIAVLLYAFTSSVRFSKALHFVVGIFSFIPRVGAAKEKVDGFAENFNASMQNFKNPRTLGVTFLFTLSIWLLEGVILSLAFLSIGVSVNYPVVLTALLISSLVSVLTLLPGGLGSGEVVMVVFFTSLMGLTMVQITTAAILGRLMSFWMTAAIGSVFLLGLNKE